MSHFMSEKWVRDQATGNWECVRCGKRMHFEDPNESVLVCDYCGFSEDIEHYGFTDDEYAELYLILEDLESGFWVDADEL